MPTVLILRSSIRMGGVERQLLDHALRLKARGWEPHLLCLHRGGGEHALASVARAAGLPATTLPDASPFSSAPLSAIRRAIAAIQPDIIHTCDYRSDVLVSLIGFRPWLAESHGHTEESLPMLLWNRLDLRALRKAQAVVAVSSAWETQLAVGRISVRRLHVLGNSAAVLDPSPVPPPIPTSPATRTLLFAGRLSPEKGLDVALEAWAELRAAFPDLTLRVLGSPGQRPHYRRRLARLLQQPGVGALGFQPDIRSWLQSAAAVIVPSRREAWGMTAFEALTMGVPVLATRVGGLPDLCRPAPHARLIPPATPAAIGPALSEILSPDFPRGPDIGERYRTRPEFDPAQRFEQLLNLYQNF